MNKKAAVSLTVLAVLAGAPTAVANAHGVTRTPGLASASTPKDVGAGVYYIVSDFDGPVKPQCLDADTNGHGNNGTKVQAWGCNRQPQQTWDYQPDHSLYNHAFNKCLDADTNGHGNNGTKLQLWDCNGQPQQKWIIPGGNDRAIYNQLFYNNGRSCVDRDTNIPGDGAQAQLWAKNYQSQQWWHVESVSAAAAK